VTKLNSTGTALVYSTFLGGAGHDVHDADAGIAIAIDSSGEAFVVGSTYSADFPVTAGAFQTTKTSPDDRRAVFVTKLNGSGTALVYSSFIGGSYDDFPMSATLDSANSVYVCGETGSADFPVTSGAFQTTNPSSNRSGGTGFISKLNAAGSSLVYSTFLGGSPDGNAGSGSLSGIAVDALGNAYAVGTTLSTDFPVTSGVFQTTDPGAQFNTPTVTVTKLNPAGTGLEYSTFLGGNNSDTSAGIAVDDSGDAYLTGYTSSANFPITTGAFEIFNKGYASGDHVIPFISKLNPTGTALIYSTFLGGSDGDQATAIAVDSAGDAYITGQANSPDFPTTPGSFQATAPGGANTGETAFMAELNPAGTAEVYSTYFGGGFYAVGDGIALGQDGSVYLAGATNDANFPVTTSAFQTTFKSTAATGFVAKFAMSSQQAIVASPTFSPAGGTYASAQSVTISDSTSGATIYYTTDGSTPSTNSTEYGGPIYVDQTTTINAIATASGDTNSAPASATYTINVEPQAAAPTFNPPAGTYTSAQTVTIADSTTGATIYYTTDGSTPTTSSTTYAGPITVSTTETISAIAAAGGFTDSGVVMATYTYNLPPVDFGVTASPASLTVNAGSSGTATATITPQNGFSSAVSFVCTGLPTGATCSFSPTTVTPSGAAATTTLTIATASSTAQLRLHTSPLLPGGAILAIAICLLGIRRRSSLQNLLLLTVCAISIGWLTGCGGGGASNTGNQGGNGGGATTSTVTVTATSGSLSHSATVSLTVK
jgi:hypothetical protein